MEKTEQELKRLSFAIKEINKKQDKTDQVLVALLDGQAKILQMGSKTEDNQRRQPPIRIPDQEETNLEWVCHKGSNDRRIHSNEKRGYGDERRGRCDGECYEESNWKARRLELPSFNGQDVDDWILKAEKYFSYYELSKKQKNGGFSGVFGRRSNDVV